MKVPPAPTTGSAKAGAWWFAVTLSLLVTAGELGAEETNSYEPGVLVREAKVYVCMFKTAVEVSSILNRFQELDSEAQTAGVEPAEIDHRKRHDRARLKELFGDCVWVKDAVHTPLCYITRRLPFPDGRVGYSVVAVRLELGDEVGRVSPFVVAIVTGNRLIGIRDCRECGGRPAECIK